MSVSSSITPAVTIAANPIGAVCAGTNVSFTATPSGGGSNPTYQWKVNNGIVGSNADTYSTTALANGDIITAILTSSAGCASPATATSNPITAIINPAPNASAGTNVTITQGGSTTLTATGGGTYLWSTGEITQSIPVSPNSTTPYTVTVTDGNGCSATAHVTVNVLLPCSYSLSASSTSLPAFGGTRTVTLTTNTNCPWVVQAGGCIDWVTVNTPNGTGASTISFSVDTNPLPSQRTCFTTIADSLFLIIQAPDATTGVQDISSLTNISVFPNPNTGTFTVSIESASNQKVKLNLFNSLGQLITKQEIQTTSRVTKTDFDLSLNETGIYYLQFLTEKNQQYLKVVKQ